VKKSIIIVGSSVSNSRTDGLWFKLNQDWVMLKHHIKSTSTPGFHCSCWWKHYSTGLSSYKRQTDQKHVLLRQIKTTTA